MIDKKAYKKWEIDDSSNLFKMISIGYDPELKGKYINLNGFDLDCKISDKHKFVEILIKYIVKYLGNEFRVYLKDDKYSWLPDWLTNEFNDYNEIKNYLDKIKWIEKKYFGGFEINNIHEFLKTFIDYPLKYEYQDIELFSIRKDYVLVLSNHGIVWFITDSETDLKAIAKLLDKDGATVFPSRFLD